MNHVTTSFHAGHQMKCHWLWTKLAFFTVEVSKCNADAMLKDGASQSSDKSVEFPDADRV